MKNLFSSIFKNVAGNESGVPIWYLVALLMFLPETLVYAQNDQAAGRDASELSVIGSDRFLQTADTGKFALIITGAAASPEIRQRFRDWTAQLDSLLQEDYDYAASDIRILLDDGDNVGNLASRVTGASTKTSVESNLNDLKSDMSAGDLLSVGLNRPPVA